jgi:hypothetical protein
MKGFKKFLIPTLGAVAAVSLASCGISHTGEPNNGVTKNEDGTFTVRVGNTNAAALLPTVFGPMDYGAKAYAYYFGESQNEGKVKMEYILRDDGYNATVRATNTAQLLNEDKVFGIVYSYADQANALEEANKPEIYTPLTMDYYQESGDSVASFPIQPIDYVEGQQLLASAFAKGEAGLGAKKVGVIAGLGSTGVDELAGMRAELKKLGKTENTDFFVQTIANDASSDYASCVAALKANGVDVLLLTDVTFLSVVAAIVASNWENLTVLASYKFSNALYFSGAYTAGILNNGRKLLTTGWIAAGVQNAETYDEWAEYVHALTAYAKSRGDALTNKDIEEAAPEVVAELQEKYEWAADGVSPYYYDSYAMAGYIGTYVFGEGISRLYKDGLLEGASTEDYVAEMEKGGMHIPMSTIEVSLKDGARTGARAMTLVNCTEANHTLGEPFRTFYDIPALEKAAK